MRLMITPELIYGLKRAKQRHDAGITSQLEAAIEQMEAVMLANPIPHGHLVIKALKEFNDGDDTMIMQLARRGK